MNFATFTQSTAYPALAPLQSLFRVFFASPDTRSPKSPLRRTRPPAFLQHQAPRQGDTVKNSGGAIERVQPQPTTPAHNTAIVGDSRWRKNLPAVRVVRMLESGQSPKAVGRMVISGTMADVCAELDRLVSHEQSTRAPVIH